VLTNTHSRSSTINPALLDDSVSSQDDSASSFIAHGGKVGSSRAPHFEEASWHSVVSNLTHLYMCRWSGHQAHHLQHAKHTWVTGRDTGLPPRHPAHTLPAAAAAAALAKKAGVGGALQTGGSGLLQGDSLEAAGGRKGAQEADGISCGRVKSSGGRPHKRSAAEISQHIATAKVCEQSSKAIK
jgi:hypothetical protein